MIYTVKKLAKLSGVSSRTLRFYDEVGLLKPAYYGDNQYRYYEEEQLLMLQQILFFRELGIPLNDIQRITSSDGFDKIDSLCTHKSTLQSSLKKTATLIKTIDKTISHIRGNLIMNDIEMYEGFNSSKQQEHEKFLLNMGVLSEKDINDSWKKVRHWKKENWDQIHFEADELNQELAKALNSHLKPDNKDVQALIRRHYTWVKCFWTPTKDSYLGLAQMYLEHSDFKEFYNQYHPQLAEYLVEAMTIFSAHELT